MAFPVLMAEMNERGISQRNVARELGVRAHTVNDWFLGRSRIPLEMAFMIRDKFFSDKSIDYLFANGD